VRSYEEFIGGHVAGSFNIPLQEIQHRMRNSRTRNTFLLCCASEIERTTQIILTAGLNVTTVALG
jgi:rhodanese-related sulfurtransferase